jgi:hypothetical protein
MERCCVDRFVPNFVLGVRVTPCITGRMYPIIKRARDFVVNFGLGPDSRHRIAGVELLAAAQHPEDIIEEPSVIHPRNATRLVRRHRLDGSPIHNRERMIRAPSLGI